MRMLDPCRPVILVTLATLSLMGARPAGAAANISPATEECLGCHEDATPGIVGDWRRSRHATISVREALKKPARERRVSVGEAPAGLGAYVVGCAECHMLNPESHADTWDHEGNAVHIVVSPPDCAVCHPVEQQQYAQNIMSEAYGNLMNNPVYVDMVHQTSGHPSFNGGGLDVAPPSPTALADSCLACHGTKVEVSGMETRETEFGELEFPVLTGWPNQGVGRINPDGSKGSCSACHTRHQFSIVMARKPETCSTCHKGPDTPAYKVYEVSKHGNIYKSLSKDWDFAAVPWKVGEHFTAPTCATCHISEVVDPSGTVLAERTHRMNDRLPWRLFGLPYAHPHPKDADTSKIVNADGLPLPTTLAGEPAAKFLIGEEEVRKRIATMSAICNACHSSQWTRGHFARLETVIEESNLQTLAATRMMEQAWSVDIARGLRVGDSLFNEPLERMWVNSWLLYGNSVRIAAAMAGADYGVFAGGRWQGSENLIRMHDVLKAHGAVAPPPAE